MLTTAPEQPGVRGLVQRTLRGVFTRYAIGSVLAAAASEAALLVTYGPGLLGPQAASVVGWAAGAAVNYALNRRWAWRRRGRASLRRELLPYWTITLTALAVATWATDAADGLGHRLFVTEGPRVVFVGGAFLAVNGLMFGVKFVLYNYVVFAGSSATRPDAGSADGERRSRHQVLRTTRR